MNSIKVIFNSIDNLIPTQKEEEYGNQPYQEQHDLSEINESDEIEDLPSEAKYSSYEDNEGYDPTEHYNEHDNLKEQAPYYDPKEPEDLINPHYSLHLIATLLLQIPYFFLVKPLVFVWIVLLYPVSYFAKSIEFNYSYQVDTQEKMEILKHENIISNDIKSPTSSSKYIIPPPQRLFPLVRNPAKGRRRKTLVIDLDETLIHSLSKGSPRTLNGNNSNVIEIKLNNIATLYHVHKRPYCDHFLQEVSKWFDLHIFTASVKEYADPIIDWLESEIISDDKIFKKRYYRNDCTYRNGVGYIKDLSKLFSNEELKNVAILDNSPVSYALHEDNAVMIEGWINDQNDKDLLNLIPLLHGLALCIDVRYILGLRQGEKVFETYSSYAKVV